MNSKGYTAGYTISIGGITVDSDTEAADLISLMTSMDTNQSDYSCDIILANTDHKYTYAFARGDEVTATIRVMSIDPNTHERTLVKEYPVFTGVATTVNWTYKEAHIICPGKEQMFCQDSPSKRRTFTYEDGSLVNRKTFVAVVVGKLITDYNSANPKTPLKTAKDLDEGGPFPKIDSFEIADGENMESVMDNICRMLQCTFWTDEDSAGDTILYLGSADSQQNTGENYDLSEMPWVGIIFDSAAVNEIGYVTEVIVHGSPVTDAAADDKNLHSTRSVWGSAYVKGVDYSIRHIDVVDYTCKGVEACQTRATSILRYGVANDSIKPVFTNFCPKLGAQIAYMDPTYTDIPISGTVTRRELRVSANEGIICNVEIKQATSIGVDLSDDNNIGHDGGED